MKKIVKYVFVVISFLTLITCILIFRPVPIVSENNTISQTGIVSKIYSNQGNDIIFLLESNPRKFYINRGLENGLDLSLLKEKLIGNTILVKYPKYWTPLDWNNSIRHISKLEFNGKVLFTELKR